MGFLSFLLFLFHNFIVEVKVIEDGEAGKVPVHIDVIYNVVSCVQFM